LFLEEFRELNPPLFAPASLEPLAVWDESASFPSLTLDSRYYFVNPLDYLSLFPLKEWVKFIFMDTPIMSMITAASGGWN
jgi:hypothetical protein